MANKNAGAFIQSTQIWEVPDINSPAFKEFLVHLYQNMNSMAILLNLKDTGQYSPREFLCGQQYTFDKNPKEVFRKVFSCGALKDTDTTSVAHGITLNTDYIFTRIYGVATNPVGATYKYLPLPYSSPTLVDNIELFVDNTNVSITTGSDRTAYTKSYCVIEFIKF